MVVTMVHIRKTIGQIEADEGQSPSKKARLANQDFDFTLLQEKVHKIENDDDCDDETQLAKAKAKNQQLMDRYTKGTSASDGSGGSPATKGAGAANSGM